MTTATMPAPAETRRLATLDTITALDPIPGADRIEVATVRGWEVVVKKGEHHVGQEVIYFEVDAALPVSDPRFAFLADRGVKTFTDAAGHLATRHVLKTIRLRKVYSQGLVIPAADFPELAGADPASYDGILGIVKWEPRTPGAPGTGRVKFNGLPFPGHITKTDAERVQNLGSRTWAAIQADSEAWDAVEKVDGTSVTVWRDAHYDSPLRVASRNWELPEPTKPTMPEKHTGLRGLWQRITGSYTKAAAAYPDALASYNARNHHWEAARTIAPYLRAGEWIQGEVAGPGIQGNPLDLPGLRLFVFGHGDKTGRVPVTLWPSWAAALRPPVHGYDLPETVKETVGQVEKIKSLITPGADAEGVVWTHYLGKAPAGLSRPVFKALSAKYLLKNG